MAETSVPWSGTTVGDAGPYTHEVWTDLWAAFFAPDTATQGIFEGTLNELEASGSVSPVAINTGYAFVDGTFYKNTASVDVTIPTPSVSTRIDRIVLRKDWSAQTVRITRIAGVEGGSAPSLTQSDGSVWDIPIAQISITTLGAITITDQRTMISVGGGGSSFWTDTPATPTRESNTTFSIPGDFSSATAYPFGKGVVWKWKESGVVKCAMQSIPQTFGSSKTTFTLIGDTMASIDTGSLKYALVEVSRIKMAYAGSISAVTSDVMGSFYAEQPLRVIGADIQVGTAGTTNNTTADVNKNGTTMFATKPTLATTVASSPTPFTADNGTSLALGDEVTIDIDAIQTTAAIDLYITLYVFPTRYLYL